MNKTFFISDTHFFQPEIHALDDLDSLDLQALLKKWKEKIDSTDTVFYIGDVGLYGEKTKDLLEDLPGKKILAMGNHDRDHTPDQWKNMGFDQVYEHPIIISDFYILSHEPKHLTVKMPYVNVHGHLHLNNMVSPHKVNRYVNVSWPNIRKEGLISFDEIKSRFI